MRFTRGVEGGTNRVAVVVAAVAVSSPLLVPRFVPTWCVAVRCAAVVVCSVVCFLCRSDVVRGVAMLVVCVAMAVRCFVPTRFVGGRGRLGQFFGQNWLSLC